MKNSTKITFVVCLLVSIALIVGGFFAPPMGVIDGSVIQAVGVLFAYTLIPVVSKGIDEHYRVKVTHKDTTLELGGNDTEKPLLVD